MSSRYVEEMERKEAELVRRKERKEQLEQLYSASGSLAEIEKNYSLNTEDTELLQEIEQEAKHQAQLDDAFLQGFSSVKH